MSPRGDLLCLHCRRHGHGAITCPGPSGSSTFDSFGETQLLDFLRAQPSLLCRRCNDYNILHVFEANDIVDTMEDVAHSDGVNHTHDVMTDWLREKQRHNLVLGHLNSILLYGSCPLCRLIFRVFPALDGEDGNSNFDAAIYYLRPFLSYDRQASFLKETDKELKMQYAIYFSVESDSKAMGNIIQYFADPNQQMLHRVVEAFSLSVPKSATVRKALGVRPISRTIDFSLLQHWLQRCSNTHGVSCHRTWSDELLTIRIVDVLRRKVVLCPPNCEYLALSYVWGNVVPEKDALEKRRLPQTIEDAITVTKQLGKRFLWVDALCIDQAPTPEKAQQLSIMDIIYQCALVTIIALSGEDSNSGLPGISPKTPRFPQGAENIDGHDWLTIYPMLAQDMEGSKYLTRAWTMQEALLTRCRLIFTRNQVHYMCNSAGFSESVDDSYDPASYLEGYHHATQESWFHNPAATSRSHYSEQERHALGEEDYRECVNNYTERQMTNDRDSLNAFLGIASYLRKSWFPKGLLWGMPLVELPQSLRWYHPRGVKPRRRPEFPSWSFTGWEGQAVYSGPLDLRHKKERGRRDVSTGMVAQFVEIHEQVLVLEAYVVKLEIKTDPFSEAYVPGSEYLLGPVRERNFLHNNTLPSGINDYLVVEKVRYSVAPDRPFREDVYLLQLDWDEKIALRRTKVRLFLGPGIDFEKALPRLQQVHLK